MPTYEELIRALMWPNAVATGPVIPHSVTPLQHLATVSEGPGGFRVSLDVHQFAPSEISVKTHGKAIVITADHEEKPDEHGYVSRHFVRRYVLPDEFDPDRVACSLSSDGVLSIAAPKVHEDEAGQKVKSVPIVISGAPAVKPKLPIHNIFPDVKSEVPIHSAKPASHHGLN